MTIQLYSSTSTSLALSNVQENSFKFWITKKKYYPSVLCKINAENQTDNMWVSIYTKAWCNINTYWKCVLISNVCYPIRNQFEQNPATGITFYVYSIVCRGCWQSDIAATHKSRYYIAGLYRDIIQVAGYSGIVCTVRYIECTMYGYRTWYLC